MFKSHKLIWFELQITNYRSSRIFELQVKQMLPNFHHIHIYMHQHKVHSLFVRTYLSIGLFGFGIKPSRPNKTQSQRLISIFDIHNYYNIDITLGRYISVTILWSKALSHFGFYCNLPSRILVKPTFFMFFYEIILSPNHAYHMPQCFAS